MSVGRDEDIEEERRLCYVAMTRARERLFLSQARLRRIQGVLMPQPPSRFIDEVPREIIDEVSPPAGNGFTDRLADGTSGSWNVYGSSAARSARRSTADTPPPRRAAAGETFDDGYDIGAWVRHPSFGGGRILDREGQGKHLKLTIQFARHGSKKILPAYTRLEIPTS
jgi:DNA helicase-2/ATP-dependent DNA helicase PcrA